MKEDFLHYLWRLQRFDFKQLQTTEGEAIQILTFGDHNHHAGPDFSNARIRIGTTLWAGNVEMHLKSSEWHLHRHQGDPAYDNVILHVVLEEDQLIFRSNGERIPCLELQRRIPKKLSSHYLKLIQEERWIPCQKQFSTVPEITRWLWLDRILVERMEEKTEKIRQNLVLTNNNWEESFYQLLARGFGLQVNAQPFETLARSLPLTLLARHKNQLRQIEALLFGQAGLLDEHFEDAYPNQLKTEYAFLRQKYQLQTMPKASWKFLRLRPANFPTIRIAQLAMLLHQSAHLFSKILAAKNVREMEHIFDRRVSAYWQTHYTFDKPSPKRPKTLGKSTIQLLVINTIAPCLFHYGTCVDDARFKDKALDLLEQLPPEKNHLISEWKNLGMTPGSAYQSQALLQLKKRYCDKKQCLRCAIGNVILK